MLHNSMKQQLHDSLVPSDVLHPLKWVGLSLKAESISSVKDFVAAAMTPCFYFESWSWIMKSVSVDKK